MPYPGHSGESYSSAEMQSVYSMAPAEWAETQTSVKIYLNKANNANIYV